MSSVFDTRRPEVPGDLGPGVPGLAGIPAKEASPEQDDTARRIGDTCLLPGQLQMLGAEGGAAAWRVGLAV